MEHTPEPWHYCPPEHVGGHEIVPEDGPTIVTLWQDTPVTRSSEEHKANARRIVACVNACGGIPTSALTEGIIQEIVDYIAAIGTQLRMTRSRIQPGNGTIADPHMERERLATVANRADELLALLDGGES